MVGCSCVPQPCPTATATEHEPSGSPIKTKRCAKGWQLRVYVLTTANKPSRVKSFLGVLSFRCLVVAVIHPIAPSLSPHDDFNKHAQRWASHGYRCMLGSVDQAQRQPPASTPVTNKNMCMLCFGQYDALFYRPALSFPSVAWKPQRICTAGQLHYHVPGSIHLTHHPDPFQRELHLYASLDFLERYIDERNKFEQDATGKVEPPLPRGLVIDGPALLEAMQTPESQRALLRAAQVRCLVWGWMRNTTGAGSGGW